MSSSPSSSSATPAFEIMAVESHAQPLLPQQQQPTAAAARSTSPSVSKASGAAASSASPTAASMSSTFTAARSSPFASSSSSHTTASPLLAAITSTPADTDAPQTSTAYPVRLARAAAAARSGALASASSSSAPFQPKARLGSGLYLHYNDQDIHHDYDEYDDDDDDDDDDTELGDYDHGDGAAEYMHDLGHASGSGSGVGNGKVHIGSLTSHRTHHRRRRRRRCGIPLDEQRAAPPPPIVSSSSGSHFSPESSVRSVASPPRPRPLSALSSHAPAASKQSCLPIPFHLTGGASGSEASRADPGVGGSGNGPYPLPETSNMLSRNERRTQVRRTQKLASMLGGEVLADEERLDNAASRASRTNTLPFVPSQGIDLGSLYISGRRGSDSTGARQHEGSSAHGLRVAQARSVSGSALSSLASAGPDARFRSKYLDDSDQTGERVASNAVSVPRHPSPGPAVTSMPQSSSANASTGLSGKVAELDQALASVLRRRTRRTISPAGHKGVAGTQQPIIVQDARSPALNSIHGNNSMAVRPSSMHITREQHPAPTSQDPTRRLTTRRSLESIRTVMSTSTFAESTLSSLDEAALERRAEAQQREERRRKLVKMTRWLGAIVPPEMVTSPMTQGSPTPGTSGSELPQPGLASQARADWMTPYSDSQLAGASAGGGVIGGPAALYGVASDEVRNKVAALAGKLIKLGGPGSGSATAVPGSSGSGSGVVSPTGTGLGTGVPPAGANLAALDLSGARAGEASYRQLRPQPLDLSGTRQFKPKLATLVRAVSDTGRDGAAGTGAGAGEVGEGDEQSPLTPVNVLSPKERITVVKRANKLERVFGEAPPHVLFSAAGMGSAETPAKAKGLHQHSNSAPVTPHPADVSGLGSSVVSGASPGFFDHSGTATIQAALDDLVVVSVPPRGSSSKASPVPAGYGYTTTSSASAAAAASHMNPYAGSIASSPRSYRSSAYRQSLDSLEYLLDNDVPLLNEMMSALDEDEDHHAAGESTPSGSGAGRVLASVSVSARPSVFVPTSSSQVDGLAGGGDEVGSSPRSPDTPGSRRRYHSTGSPVLVDSTRREQARAMAGPSGQNFADRTVAVSSPLRQGCMQQQSRSGGGGVADHLAGLSPLQNAPWDWVDALTPPGDRSHFWPQSGGTEGVAVIEGGVRDTSTRRHSGTDSRNASSHDDGAGPSSSQAQAQRPSSPRRQSETALSRRASQVSSSSTLNFSMISSSTTSSSPPPSPGSISRRDPVYAEHELRRARALRAQKLGRFFGAAPNLMADGSAGVGLATTAPLGATSSNSNTNTSASAYTSASLPGAGPTCSSSGGPSAPPGGGRRLAPRSAGSAKPHDRFMEMLRSLEEEAMLDETLSPMERKEIRDRVKAMVRREMM